MWDQIFFFVWFEGVAPREVVQRGVNFLEVPRVLERLRCPYDFNAGADTRNVGHDDVRRVLEFGIVNQLEARHREVRMFA